MLDNFTDPPNRVLQMCLQCVDALTSQITDWGIFRPSDMSARTDTTSNSSYKGDENQTYHYLSYLSEK